MSWLSDKRNSWNPTNALERDLPTTPVAMIPRNHGLGSSALGAVATTDDVELDPRHTAHCVHYLLNCEGV